MRHVSKLALAVILLSAIIGCAGRPPTGAERAAALSKWLDTQQFSTWRTFRHTGATPNHPASPDGLTLGSPNIFAAIGEKPGDLTSLDIFWADKRQVRLMARPLIVSLAISGRGISKEAAQRSVPLADFPEQTLSRVRHTSIAVSESKRDDLKVTILDFAPVSPESNFLCRWFVIENIGKQMRRADIMLKTMVQGEPERLNNHSCKLGEKLAIVSDAGLRAGADEIRVSIGRIDPGERASAAVLLVGSQRPVSLASYVEQARAALPRLIELLDETKTDWEQWCALSPLQTGDMQIDDLLDSLLCLVRNHVGSEAIHTGSLRYPHDRAWVRDSYWVQRALLELGHAEEAKLSLDFFHNAWRASGIASSYEIPTRKGIPLGYDKVELPHYLVLMVRDAEQMGGAQGEAYWDMVRGCLDGAVVPSSGLQPMNGDETWLLAAPVRELDALLDNSWLLIASAEYGADLAARMGDATRVAHYQTIVSHARAGLDEFIARRGQSWFATGYGADGSRDLSLCPEVLARGAILGVLPATDPRISSGLTAGWNYLSYERGIRTHARSATITGGAPGYVLYAGADAPGCTFVSDLLRRMTQFASATGCVWELHDLYDPEWGGEKRRLWDSAVVLMGMVHAAFTAHRVDGKLQFVPRPPLKLGQIPNAVRSQSPFDGEQLLADRGKALVLQQDSPEHAARIARELLRQRNELFGIKLYSGKLPDKESAIIVSRNRPPGQFRQVSDYWVRDWSGPPQLWVQNKGHVFLDTDAVIADLMLYLAPKREKPLPFPDANFDLVWRHGTGVFRTTVGQAEIGAVSLFRHAERRLDLSGSKVTLKPGSAEVTVTSMADPELQNVLRLSVSAAPHETQLEAEVTLPAGWWLVYARDMTGKWDRVRDPVGETRLPDGRIRLDYSFRPNKEAVSITFSLAKLSLQPDLWNPESPFQ